MSAVEQKMPGYFTDGITESSSEKEGFDTDHVPISEKDYSYALGEDSDTVGCLPRPASRRGGGASLMRLGCLYRPAGIHPQEACARLRSDP